LFAEQTTDRITRLFTENGVQTAIHYPIPPHKQKKALQQYHELSLSYYKEKMHDEVLSIPLNCFIREEVDLLSQLK
jgi:dTDP-4-amino-4,6-dideoxygalactose transaminase